MSIELGSRVRDIVSGFKGIATARIDYLFENPGIRISPEELTESGGIRAPEWIPEVQVEVIKEAKIMSTSVKEEIN